MPAEVLAPSPAYWRLCGGSQTAADEWALSTHRATEDRPVLRRAC